MSNRFQVNPKTKLLTLRSIKKGCVCNQHEKNKTVPVVLLTMIAAFFIRSAVFGGVFAFVLIFMQVPAWATGPANGERNDSNHFDALIDMSLEELVEVEISLATGSLKSIRRAPAVATVITAEDIERIGARTLDEALETVPGLHIVPSSKNSMDTIYSIRGIHTSLNPQVLLMVNGLPVSFSYTGARPLGFQLPTSMISRIEIMRGPGSAVHGADAFAGTINVITKNSLEINGTNSGIRYGSFNTTDIFLQHGRQYKGWDVALGLDYMKSKGDKGRIIESDTQTTFDNIYGTSASLAPGPLNTGFEIFNSHLEISKDNWTFRGWGWLLNNDGMADGVTQTLASNNLDAKQYVADLIYNNNDKLLQDTKLTTRLNYSYLKTDSYLQLFPPGARFPIGKDGNINIKNPVGQTYFPDGFTGHPVIIDQQLGFEQSLFYEGLDRQCWRVAIGYKYIQNKPSESKNFGPGVLDGSQVVSTDQLTDVTGTSDIFMENQTRHLGYVSLQDEWSFANDWEFTAGLRYDQYSDFGNTVNPRAALVWQSRDDLTTKFLFGRAFRPPAFVELYAKNNPSNQGNTDLVPETIQTYEIAFDYLPTNKLRAMLNVFYYDINDLIELVPDQGQTTLTAQNKKNRKGYGFEIELNWEITSKLSLNSNFAYQRSEDKETGEVTPDAPEIQFYLNPYWTFLPHWSLDSQFYWIAGRHRAAADTRPDIKDYSLVNLTLRRKNVAKHWDMAFALRNLFNEDIREPSSEGIPNDYPMEGRSLWAEVRYKF